MEQTTFTIIIRVIPGAYKRTENGRSFYPTKSIAGYARRKIYASLDQAVQDLAKFFDTVYKDACPGDVRAYLCLGAVTSGLPIVDYKCIKQATKRRKFLSPEVIAKQKEAREARLLAEKQNNEWWN